MAGALPPASRLKEEELVALCGVSRTPVREALRLLAADDYVTLVRNQGAQVKAWSTDDLEELFDLRAVLEGHAAARAALRIGAAEIRRMEESIDEMEALFASRASAEQQTETFLRLNWALHESVWVAAGSVRLQAALVRLIEQAVVVRTARRYTLERIARSHQHHRELVDALRAGDAIWAEATMRSHIRAALAEMREQPLRVGDTAQQAPVKGLQGHH